MNFSFSRWGVWAGLTASLFGAPEGFINTVGLHLAPIAAGEFSMGQDARQTTSLGEAGHPVPGSR